LRPEICRSCRVEPEALVPDFSDLVYGHVEKITVVRNQHESVGIVAQIFFQPVAGFEVEMIGGFVQQEQVWFLQQQLGQGEAHLPAAGKFFGRRSQSSLPKAQPHQNASYV
jgi:hypothetical protein